MLDRLPDFIDPIVFADKQRQLEGVVELTKLNRLNEVLFSDDGCVDVKLSFKKEKRLTIVSGHLTAQLKLSCQSCLEAIDWPVDINVHLAFVASLAEADLLAGEYEPLLLDEDKVSLSKLVEDEILLALPDFPRHSQPCLNQPNLNMTEAEKQDNPQSTSPFAVLAQLKNTGD